MKDRFSTHILVGLWAIALVFFTVAAGNGVRLQAQAVKASISGTVNDATGAAVAGAKLEVTNTGTGITQSVTTDSQGRYTVPELPVGTYDMQASMTGFKTSVRKGLQLNVGAQVVMDFSLAVGQVQEAIVVEGAAPQVDVTSAAVGQVVNQVQIRELPLNGRNFEQLLTLAPGVQQIGASGGSFYGGGTNYSVAGSRPEGQAFMLDDTNISNFWNHGTGSGAAGTSLGVEAIGEFQTLTNTYSAQFGGNGAVVNAVTKSGTNGIHGSAYEFLRNSALDARNYFDALTGPPPFRRNQFGGSLGGPIKKDKAFFYVNYEGLRQLLAETRVALAPDANAHQGFLPCSAAPGVPCGANGLANVGVAPNVASTLGVWPVATTPIGGGIGSFNEVASRIAHENYILGRVDYNLSSKDSLFVRYVSDRAQLIEPFNSSNIPLWPETDKTGNQYLTLEEKRVVSANLVNSARFSFVRPLETGVITGSTPPLQYLPGSGREDGQVAVTGLTSIGAALTLPFQLVPNRFEGADDVFLVKGAHALKFGLSVTRVQDNTNAPFLVGESWTFNSLEQLLQGKAFMIRGALPGAQNADAFRDLRELWITPYIHDDWKLSPKLTLNLGVRYEYAANPTERQNKLTAIVDPPNGTGFTPVTHVFKNNPSLRNFDPRIGFAYDVFADHKTSIRGGFGLFHDVIEGRTILPAYWLSPPFAIAFQLNPSYPTPFAGGASPTAPTTTQGLDYRTDTTPYMMQYNLTVEHDFAGNVVSIGYVGSRGVHLVTMTDLNPPTYTVNAAGQKVFAKLVNGKIVSNPRLNPVFGPLQSKETFGSSNYNSLQINVNRQFSHSIQWQANYTWSKSLDYGSQTYGLEGNAATQQIEDPYNIAIERSRSTFDRTHSFRTSTVLSLPFKKNALVKGWQVSGIFSAVSGPPANIFVGFDEAGLGVGNTQRPNQVAGFSNNPVLGGVKKWFDPTAFTLPAVGTYGNVGRDTLIGPGLWDLDAALTKSTAITEGLNLQFRAEFFNIFNHTNFDLPDRNIFGGNGKPNPTAGLITATAPGTTSRQLQFALKFVF